MAEEDSGSSSVPRALPIGAIGAALAIGVAAAAYNYLTREDAGESTAAKTPAKGKSGSMRRRLGLMTLITLLENDATRRVVITLLKAMARRA